MPLFASIYTRGAGIGPATAFLYSGPAINVLAIILTAKILGWKLGLARAVGAIFFSIVTGLLMAVIFWKQDIAYKDGKIYIPEEEKKERSLLQDTTYIGTMVLILIFAAFAKPDSESTGLWPFLYSMKWFITGFLLIILGVMLKLWFSREQRKSWIESTWSFTKQILPLLFAGVLLAGFMLGRPGHSALIPEQWIQSFLGGNSLRANLVASIAGSLMYFATLTEVPILQGLLGAGMGKGPALALLLAGPALSLPNMIVIASIMGVKKTVTFSSIIVIFSTIAGICYGAMVH